MRITLQGLGQQVGILPEASAWQGINKLRQAGPAVCPGGGCLAQAPQSLLNGVGCMLCTGEWWHSLLWIKQFFCMCSTAAPDLMQLGKHIASLELMTACCNSTLHSQAAHQGRC